VHAHCTVYSATDNTEGSLLVLFLGFGVPFAPSPLDTLRAEHLRINKREQLTEYENHKK